LQQLHLVRWMVLRLERLLFPAVRVLLPALRVHFPA
jgi:hypothetical protein